MKKLKDFLYDNNDLIVAFAILVVAAFLIMWRMDTIIEYPKTLVGGEAPEVSEPAPDNNSQDVKDSDSKEDEKDQSTPAADDNKKDDKSSDDDSSSEQPKELWTNGALSKTVEVKVSGDSAAAAVQCLIDADLFKDYSEYQSLCDSLGIDHQKVSAGNFTFEKGTTKKDIARAINWS